MSVYRVLFLLVAAALILGAAAPAEARQSGARKIEIQGDDIQGQPFTVEELGALVVHKGGKLEVLFTMPGEHRLKVYRDVDIQEGDQVMMVNGKKAESIDDLKQALTVLKVGDEIKLGLKRGKDMKILSFPKADPEVLPKMRRMVVTSDDEGDGPKMTMKGDGVEEEVTMLMGSGLIARPGKDGPEVAYLMPDAAAIIGVADVQKGDRIQSLQGKSIKDLASLTAAWDKIAVGDAVELELLRDGKAHTIKFARAEKPKGGMMMIKK